MAIPLCIEIPPVPDPFQLTLPGGVTMEAVNMMEMVQPALTPLVPLFNVIDTVVAIYNCVKAIPDALSMPPDPTAIAACLPDLAEKISALLRLIPQLSLPYTIIGVVDLVIQTLEKARSQLLHLQQQMVQITGATERARDLGDAGLMAIAACAEANVAQEAANIGRSLGSMGKLLGLLDMFMEMVGGPKVPDLSSIAGRPLDDVIPPIDALVKTLRTVRDAVPVP